MTRNPLLLTAICLIHRDRGGRLPERRHELYSECVNAILEHWRAAKGLPPTFTAATARQVLAPVAAFLHQREGRTFATAAELEPVLGAALARAECRAVTPAQFLATIRDESGLLSGLGGGKYAFMHLGFQEYLAALELRRDLFAAAGEAGEFRRRVGALAELFGASWWEEVLLLALAVEGPPLFEPLLREVVRTRQLVDCAALVGHCLADASEASAGPFEGLFTPEGAVGEALLERQRVAARVLKTRFPEAWQRLCPTLAQHEDREIRELAGGSGAAAVTVVERRGIELVQIPGGTFWMGVEDEQAEQDEWIRKASVPRHRVTVQPFALARAPVTNAQYAAFLEASPRGVAEPKYWSDQRYNGPQQPVVGVTWEDARVYCEWAGLRLPSEAEWEYACRAGSETRYSAGDGEDALRRVGWYSENAEGRLHDVAEKPANDFGLHDMHGNVFEWCHDRWHASYKGAVTDGIAWEDGASGLRVFRGGSFGLPAGNARSAYRSWFVAGDRWSYVGFRPAL